MRHGMFAITLLAMSTAASAADTGPGSEAVLVESPALDGVWSITVPDEVGVGLDLSAHWGTMSKQYCRFEGAKTHIKILCFGPRFFLRAGTAETNGNTIHLAWSIALARFHIDATRDTAFDFKGTFGFTFMGIPHHDPEPATGTKLVIANGAPDAAGKADLLVRSLKQIGDGELAEPHDDAAIKRSLDGTKLVSPEDVRALGAIEAVSYVGETTRQVHGKIENLFSVYRIEFSSGERLCGLHQRDGGVLDALACI